jgi:hypothetical protein
LDRDLGHYDQAANANACSTACGSSMVTK